MTTCTVSKNTIKFDCRLKPGNTVSPTIVKNNSVRKAVVGAVTSGAHHSYNAIRSGWKKARGAVTGLTRRMSRARGKIRDAQQEGGRNMNKTCKKNNLKKRFYKKRSSKKRSAKKRSAKKR